MNFDLCTLMRNYQAIFIPKFLIALLFFGSRKISDLFPRYVNRKLLVTSVRKIGLKNILEFTKGTINQPNVSSRRLYTLFYSLRKRMETVSNLNNHSNFSETIGGCRGALIKISLFVFFSRPSSQKTSNKGAGRKWFENYTVPQAAIYSRA